MTILLPNQLEGRGVLVRNSTLVQQAFVAATRTYIAGSSLQVPNGPLKPGTRLLWRFNMAKTGAGTATSAIAIAVGSLATTTDTDRVIFTKPAGTAVADEAQVTIEAHVRSVSATGVLAAEFVLVHGLAATGHAVIPVVVLNGISAGFDLSGAVDPIIFGLTLTSGAADAITTEIVHAEMLVPN